MCSVVLFFVKQKTAYEMRISDWSSDVCSSDLHRVERHVGADVAAAVAVRPRRADEMLFRQCLFHLVDDVRLGRHDQRVAGEGLGKIENAAGDRKSVGWGKSVSVRVGLGRGLIIKKTKRYISKKNTV